jgi:hypothetical protein
MSLSRSPFNSGLGQTSFQVESRSRCPTSKACTALQRHWQLQPKSRSLGSDSFALQCGSCVSFPQALPVLLTTRKMGFLLAGPASAGAPLGCGACSRPQESCTGTPGRLNHPNLRWLPEPGPRVGSRRCTSLLWLRGARALQVAAPGPRPGGRPNLKSPGPGRAGKGPRRRPSEWGCTVAICQWELGSWIPSRHGMPLGARWPGANHRRNRALPTQKEAPG